VTRMIDAASLLCTLQLVLFVHKIGGSCGGRQGGHEPRQARQRRPRPPLSFVSGTSTRAFGRRWGADWRRWYPAPWWSFWRSAAASHHCCHRSSVP